MIFHFLRQPYEKLTQELKTRKAIILQFGLQVESSKKLFDQLFNGLGTNEKITEEAVKNAKDQANEYSNALVQYRLENGRWIFWASVLVYILKPIIGCVTCMASVWTFVWWFVLDLEFSETVILAVLVVATFNSLIHGLYEVMYKYVHGK